MFEISMTIKGLKGLDQRLERYARRREKALHGAMRGAAYELSRELKKEVGAGSPGGKSQVGLSGIARGLKRGRKTPLGGFARSAKYHVILGPDFRISIGWPRERTESKLRGLISSHQAGFSKPVSERQRAFLREAGKKKSTRSPLKKYYFLKKLTTSLRTPARPIVEPFWRAHRAGTLRKIRRDYFAKLRGERT